MERDTIAAGVGVGIALEVQDTRPVKQHQFDEDHVDELQRESQLANSIHDGNTCLSRENLRGQLFVDLRSQQNHKLWTNVDDDTRKGERLSRFADRQSFYSNVQRKVLELEKPKGW